MGNTGYLHKIFMTYRRVEGVWSYEFSDDYLWTLGPVRRTGDPNVIRGMAERGGALKNSKEKNSFELGLNQGSGGVMLWLTDEQMTALGPAHK